MTPEREALLIDAMVLDAEQLCTVGEGRDSPWMLLLLGKPMPESLRFTLEQLADTFATTIRKDLDIEAWEILEILPQVRIACGLLELRTSG